MGKAIIFASDKHETNNKKNEHMKIKTLLFVALATLGLTASTMAQNLPNYVPANGLVGWWPFNGNLVDESGNNLNGNFFTPEPSLPSVTLTQDRFLVNNSALSFPGAGMGVALPAPLNGTFTDEMSYSLWFKQDFLNDFICLLDATYSGRICLIAPNSNSIRAYNGAGFYLSGNHPELNTNTWKHLVVNYSQGTISIYLNNDLIGTLPTGSSFTFPDSQTLLGIYSGTIYSYIGLLDDLAIYNRALTQQEITNLFNSTNCSNNLTIIPITNQLATGGTALFNATTTDASPSYLWQSDFGQGVQTLNNYGNYSGVNTNSLSISNVQLQNHNQPIRVISTSGECIDTSDVAYISIIDTCINNVNDTTLISVTDTLIINTTITGINPQNNSNTIKVFPNPANSHITIDYGNFVIMNGYLLKIENSIGQQVFQTNITQQTDYLSLNNWGGNGLYFVHIIDAQGNTIDIRKIVLQ